MVIGIKYCGGCNSRYDRTGCVEKLKKKFPPHTYVTAADNTECDIWLLVCGCQSACVSGEGLKARKGMMTLCTMKDFVEAEKYIAHFQSAGETMEGESCQKQAKILRVGDLASYRKTFFKEDAERFASLTGDRSRLHTDVSFAAGQRFRRPVVHGVLVGSLISTVMGMQLPGEGTVFMEEKLIFSNPVYYGDTITAVVKFVSCREFPESYVGTFYGECLNQNGETAVRGLCRQMMDKRLFMVVNPSEEAEEKIELE